MADEEDVWEFLREMNPATQFQHDHNDQALTVEDLATMQKMIRQHDKLAMQRMVSGILRPKIEPVILPEDDLRRDTFIDSGFVWRNHASDSVNALAYAMGSAGMSLVDETKEELEKRLKLEIEFWRQETRDAREGLKEMTESRNEWRDLQQMWGYRIKGGVFTRIRGRWKTRKRKKNQGLFERNNNGL